jgi:transcriptional regulator with GAF, ATPase, and Fis domain
VAALTKPLLSAVGVGVVFYSLAVLWLAATTPDLGIRTLLRDAAPAAGQSVPGVILRRAHGVRALGGGFTPSAGDRVLEIGDRSISSFVDFARCIVELRSAEVPRGGLGSYSDEELIAQERLLPPIVDRGGERFIKGVFSRGNKIHRVWLEMHPVPWHELAQTFVWFVLEFGIFAVGALAFWTRPFDRQARLFFAMCVVAMGGFVGGFHWWMISGVPWLILPFVVCAMLVPVVTFHFFCIYPEPKAFFAKRPAVAALSIYGVPIAWTAVVAALVVATNVLYDAQASPGLLQSVLWWLAESVYWYLVVAAVYFLMTLAALAGSFFTTRNPILHGQVKWILWAALVATAPVAYTLYLARFHEESFALGAASFPMFTASLLFMLAYCIGIVRYKLMLIEQIVSRGMVYYILTLSVTVVYSLAVAAASAVGIYRNTQILQHAPIVMALVAMAVLLLSWSRDRLQQLIDRRFFREKFQLDRALQRMTESPAAVSEPQDIAQRVLGAFRDLLAVDRAALYLRDEGGNTFRLVAAEQLERAPLRLASDQELLALLEEDPSVQRASAPADASPAQVTLRDLGAELVHALELDGRLEGLLVLGPKRNGTRFSAEDLALLSSLGQVTGVALNGARVHEAIARLNEELDRRLRKIEEQQRLISMLQSEITARPLLEAPQAPQPFRCELIKGSSPAMRAVLDTARKASGSDSTVLIRGESGTGKELLALTLHDNSPRRTGPLVSVHCAALAPGLLESELFGHVKGSFTGAHKDKVGRFEMAHGGTLFLDEIGDISIETQIKLLRVLQERRFEPVGGTRPVEVDVRLITATHQDLESLIALGRFREDLYYRLNVISITLPPLRERGDDVLELALYFLSRAAKRAGRPVGHFTVEAMQALRNYPWPGNIRELENAVERSVVMAEGPGIDLRDLPASITAAAARPVVEIKPQRRPVELARSAARATPAPETALSAEREALLDALTRAGGNKAEAARLLGIPRSTLFSRLKKCGVE